jgi:hypothetical protein
VDRVAQLRASLIDGATNVSSCHSGLRNFDARAGRTKPDGTSSPQLMC